MIAHGKEIKVFTANANVPFAKGICAELGLDLGDSTVTAFADGEVSVSINESVRGCDVFVVQSTCKPVNNNLMELPVDSTERFQLYLLQEFEDNGETVMFAPGSGFYATPGAGTSEIRIAYVRCVEELERSLTLLRLAIERYNQK